VPISRCPGGSATPVNRPLTFPSRYTAARWACVSRPARSTTTLPSIVPSRLVVLIAARMVSRIGPASSGSPVEVPV
jgi:hypothetical protein